ncbi:hypothetical protein [Pseudomonas phage vB_Pae_CF74b]|nr:hypothetical protein [Pseudomonas phage vB_Pae_CF74b]
MGIRTPSGIQVRLSQSDSRGGRRLLCLCPAQCTYSSIPISCYLLKRCPQSLHLGRTCCIQGGN